MKSVTVIFHGGIGNQLFQYAAALYLQKKHHCKLFLETDIYYKIKNQYKRKFILNKLGVKQNKPPIKNLLYFFLKKIFPKKINNKYLFLKNFFCIDDLNNNITNLIYNDQHNLSDDATLYETEYPDGNHFPGPVFITNLTFYKTKDYYDLSTAAKKLVDNSKPYISNITYCEGPNPDYPLET